MAHRSSVRINALRQLQKAFRLSLYARHNSVTDLSALVEEEKKIHAISRRKFIGDTSKALAAVGLAGLYHGCKIPAGKSAQPVIAIIGGGIAGLHAAYVLKNAGITAQVYEGSPRTGGRIMSVTGMMGEGLWTEMGGEFIDSDHQDMLDLALHFNLPLLDRHVPSETNLKEFAYFFEGKHYELADVLKALHPYSEQIKNDIDSLSDDITFEKHSENDVRLDNLSITDYLDQLGMKGWFRDFITASYLAEYGMEIEEQSAINFLSIFDPGNDKEYKIYGTSDERYSVVGGNSKICDALSDALGTQVLKEHLLTAISQNEDKSYQLTFRIAETGEIEATADVVLMTLPFTLLREVDIKVPFPEWKMNVIKNLGYGSSSKLFVGVKERVWRKQGYTGYAFSDNAVTSGWDHTQLQQNNQGTGGYTIFLAGKAGEDSGKTPMEELQNKYVPALDAIFPGVKDQFDNNFQQWYWPGYAYAKASYVSYKKGQYTTMSGAQFKPVDNIFFAGEHCSYEFQGFMNGGAETGRQAAELILEKFGAEKTPGQANGNSKKENKADSARAGQ